MPENTIAPIQPAERISEIDIIRGFALFGILMVNMSFFKIPMFFERYPSNFPEGIEQVSAWVIQLFFTGKFYAIFSFLFGLGFYIFMERTLARGMELVPLYRRRLLALMLFGFIHLFFIWSGDILFAYALVGFIMLRFRDKSPESLKKWIVGLFATALVLNGTFSLLSGYSEIMAGEEYGLIVQQMLDGATAVYRYGSFGQLVAFRAVNELPYVIISMIVWIPAILAFFLCGLYAGKKELFKDIPGNAAFLKKIRNIGLPVGAMLMLFYFLVETGTFPVSTLFWHSALAVLNYSASLFLFPAYVALVALALQGDFFKKLLYPLAAPGRMALTNYLSQTVICIFIFYGFGLGLYANVNAAHGILIAIAIYFIQVAWSNLWLKKFRYGPMEWLWRVLTYKKKQPFTYS